MKPLGEVLDLPRALCELRAGYWNACFEGFLVDCVRSAVRAHRIRRPSYVGLDGPRWDATTFQAAAFEFAGDRLFPKLHVLEREAAAQGLGGGYLRRMVERWLVDRQRARDPIGASNFKAWRAGLAAAVAAGVLARDGGGRIDKRTTLRFPGAVPYAEPWTANQLASSVISIEAWPQLRDRLRSRGEAAPAELAMVLERLRTDGCPGFVFQDLIAALHGAAGVGGPRSLPDGFEPADPDARHPAGGLDHEELVQGLRQDIDALPIRESRRALLHALVEETVTAASGGARVNLAAFGERHGLARQRAHEICSQLQELASARLARAKRRPAGGQR